MAIDENLFTVRGLLQALLQDTQLGIEPRATKWLVRCGAWYLRYSAGPRLGVFWDSYGDDFRRTQAPPA